MNKEILILLLSWLISIIVLIKFVPIDRKRIAHITFLFGHGIAWIYQYVQLLFNLVEFPYREFEYATKMSFSLYYLTYPTFGVLFIMFYPANKGRQRIIIHYLIFTIAITTYAFFIENYSSLSYWKSWNIYSGLLSNLIIIYVIKKFVFWFQKGLFKFNCENE
ncbi:CBO0543 family protein [Neobacillus jeddahensis]|uniref:CBO0543 family protein n=1 Tax=Neobacillus jeddahensis TaxID=1461580 RepID=UPI00059081DE|nr:CBO0543 family protein [Neobacillus jeddahensis]